MLSRRRLALGTVLVVLVGLGVLVGASAAEQRALDAEEAYVTAKLDDADCLTYRGVREGAGPSTDAAVTGPAGVGLRVNVTLRYAYTAETSEGELHADAASEAVYVVTPFETRRVNGDDVEPC